MSGFVAMHRDALDHHLFEGDVARLGAWLWMVAKACWKPTRFNVHGKTVELDRGQFCCSVRELGVAWGWSKSTVDRFLGRLKAEGMILTDAGTGRLVVTICNYGKYQDVGDSAGTDFGANAHPNATRAQPESKPGHSETTRNPQETAVFEVVEDDPWDTSGTAAGQQRDIKEQGNKGTTLSSSEDSGFGDEISPAFDPAKIAFESGVTVLTAAGIAERQARTMIGKWKKTFTVGQILDALGAYDAKARSRHPPSEPISWITQQLYHALKDQTNERYRPVGNDEPRNAFVRAHLEREAQRAAAER